MDIKNLEKSMGIELENKDMLETAFTHRSYANEKKIESNEKLEFLGDAILDLIVGEYLYRNYYKLKEGEMTKVRAAVVCEESLYKIAEKHNFSDFLKLGKTEYVTNGSEKPAILADAVEALIATIYLEMGMDKARDFVIENLKDEIENASKNVGMKDYKTVLQEKLQVNGDVKINYKVTKETGPDHDKTFDVEVEVNGEVVGRGTRKNKKSS
ncbi:MAG: ribonuclease III [Lachnospiraceae bacterium]|jgi:ribonuclease-3|nr:ribonuclease III [Lachnospiraceae bacterium]